MEDFCLFTFTDPRLNLAFPSVLNIDNQSPGFIANRKQTFDTISADSNITYAHDLAISV